MDAQIERVIADVHSTLRGSSQTQCDNPTCEFCQREIAAYRELVNRVLQIAAQKCATNENPDPHGECTSMCHDADADLLRSLASDGAAKGEAK